MSYRSSLQRVAARLSAFIGRPRNWLLIFALFALLPDAAHAACGTMSVPDSYTTPSTSPMVSGGTITIDVGVRCDGFGLNPYPGPGTANPSHGTVSVDTLAGTVIYTNNGDGATSDSFVVADASAQPFTVNVAIAAATSPITVSPASLPTPQVGTAYSQTLSASGGTAPYSYAVTSGSLPPGLNLSGATISGTPDQAGGYTATITVTDNVGTTGTKSYTANVPIPTIAIASPPTANLNTAYSYDLNPNTSGALAPYTYVLLSGSLPPGLSLSGGVISGTPTVAGTSSFVLHAVDSSPNIAGVSPGPYATNVNLSITVQNVPPTAGPASATVAYDSTNNPITLNITGAPATSVAVATVAAHGTATASGTSISYTPTGGYAGPDSFTYTATNGAGTSSPATVTITVSPPTILYTPAAPPHPTAGVAYSHSLANASGGTAPYTYTVFTGALPAGLTLASNGTISGTSTAVGTFTFEVVATDSSTGTGPFTSAPANVTLIVDAPIITLAPSTLPGGTVNTAYSQTITATGGTAPYTTYTVIAGMLPTGITLSSGGVLSGTPTQAGSFNITVTATDSTTGPSAPYSGSRAYTLTIAGPTITVSPGTLPDGAVGTNYSQTLSAAGGTAPYSFSATGSLPPGLALNAAGTLSGTPTTAGDFTFTAIATDTQSFTGSQAYTVHVAAIAPGAPTIGTAMAGDTSAIVSFTPPASDGGSPITGYTVTSSPGGITATGAASPITVSGLTNGTAYTFTVTATNSAGISVASAASNSVTPKGAQAITFNNPSTQSFGTSPTLMATASSGLTPTFTSTTTGVCTITSGGTLTFISAGTCTIDADQAGDGTYLAAPTVTQSFTVAAIVPGAPTIGAATADDAGASVSFTPPASNGGAPITGYAVSSSPGGLTGSGAGSPLLVTGLTNGTAYTFTVTATNSAGTGSASAASNSVTPKGVQTITFNNPGAQNFGTSPQLVATASSGLAVTFTASTSAVCTITATGVLTTVSPGTCSISVDQAGNGAYLAASQVTQSFAIVVAGGTLSIDTTSLPQGIAGTAYSQTIAASGGATPYTFTLSAGALPPGVSLGGSVLSGTPTVAGSFTFTVQAIDAATQTDTQTLSLVVAAPTVVMSPGTLPSGTVGSAYSQSLSASGGTAPYTFAVTAGALPAGLTLASDGTLSGTPTAGGTFNATVTATDALGFTATQPYALTVAGPAITITPATLPGATAGSAYRQNMAATGGIAPYSFAITAGALPAGLALASDGTLSGTPTASGSFDVSVTATDSSTGGGPYAVTQTYTLVVTAAPPVVAPDRATTLSGIAVDIAVTANDSGRIDSIALATAPQHGTATVSGLVVTYAPAANYAGDDTFRYVATGPGGTSTPAAVTVTVDPVPVAVSRTVDAMPGIEATVDLTEGATGGPFTGATLVALAPAAAGTATVTAESGAWVLHFTPDGNFSGTASARFTLDNAYTKSAEATITFQVQPRPDPRLDARVQGLLDAQVESARRFAQAQLGNFRQRLEHLHGAGARDGRFSSNVTFARRDCPQATDQSALEECRRTQGEAQVQAREDGGAQPHAGNPATGATYGVWTGGMIRSGSFDGRGGSGVGFESDGLSAGVDFDLTPAFSLGAGLGYGRDDNTVGDGDSRLRGNAHAFVAYASYHPWEHWFVDGMLGYQQLGYDATRQLTTASGVVRGHRDGDQWFGSLSVGADIQQGAFQLTPYARVEIARGTLDAYTEAGHPFLALRYEAMDIDSTTGNLGLRLDFRHHTAWGWLTPRLRLEYQREFADADANLMRYADLANGPYYALTPSIFDRSRFVFGLGATLDSNSGWSTRIEYQAQAGSQRDEGVQANLQKDF